MGQFQSPCHHTSLTFASRVVGTTSTKTSLTLKNNQIVPLTIQGVSTSGDFAQTSTCPLSPNLLGPGATCAISVTFTPTAPGTRTGTLTITDSASTSPQTVSLSAPVTSQGCFRSLLRRQIQSSHRELNCSLLPPVRGRRADRQYHSVCQLVVLGPVSCHRELDRAGTGGHARSGNHYCLLRISQGGDDGYCCDLRP